MAERLKRGSMWVLVAIAFVAFAWPLWTGGSVLFPADFLRGRAPYSLSKGEPPAFSRRRHQGDVVTEMIPWQLDARRQWRGGHPPLWTDSQLAGTPLAANDQSGVWWPPNLLAVLFPASLQWTAKALLRLAISAAGMVLLLRRWGAGPPGQALGAVVYTFGFMSMFYLGWPHGNAAAMVPWLALALEHLRDAPGPRPAAGLAVAIALAVFGGHQETGADVFLGLGLFFLARLPGAASPARSVLWAFAGAGVSALLAALHLLPMLELLQRTAIWKDRGAFQGHFPLREMLLWIAPDGYGYHSWLARPDAGPPSFDVIAISKERMNAYIGLAALAAIPAVAFVRERRPIVVALLVQVAFWIAVIYGLGLDRVLHRIPVLGRANPDRALFLVSFALAAAAGLGLQEAVSRLRLTLGAAGALAAASLAVVAVMVTPLGKTQGMIPIVAAIAAGIALFALRGDAVRAAWAFAAIAALEPVVFLASQNQWAPAATVFPREPVRALLTPNDGLSGTYDGMLPPSIASAYGFRDIRAYEPMLTTRWRSFCDLLDPAAATNPTVDRITCLLLQPDAEMARVAGMNRYLVGGSPDPASGWISAETPRSGTAEKVTGSLFEQPFRCEQGTLLAMSLFIPAGNFSAAIRTSGGDAVFHDTLRDRNGSTLTRLARGLPCPADYTLVLKSPQPATLPAFPSSGLRVDSAPVASNLPLVAWSHRLHADRPHWMGPLVMLQDSGARPFAWIAERAVPAAGADDALARLRTNLGQPGLWAVVEDPADAGGPRQAGESVVATRPRPGRVEADVVATGERWLVFQVSHDPGWIATVDGARVPLVPANVVFSAVRVPDGPHHVVLVYRPFAFTLGLVLALAGVATVALLFRMYTPPPP